MPNSLIVLSGMMMGMSVFAGWGFYEKRKDERRAREAQKSQVSSKPELKP